MTTMNFADSAIQITLFPNTKTPIGETKVMTWRELESMVSSYTGAKDKLDQPMLKLGVFEDNQRNGLKLRRLSGLELDIDGKQNLDSPLDMYSALKLLEDNGYSALGYETTSNTREAPCYRILMPFHTPIECPQGVTDELKVKLEHYVDQVRSILPVKLDSCATVPAQAYYYGQKYDGGIVGRKLTKTGKHFLDLMALPQPHEKWEENIKKGEQLHDSLIRLAGHYAQKLLPHKDIEKIIRPQLLASAAKDARYADWKSRYDDLDRTIATAVEKFGGSKVFTPDPERAKFFTIDEDAVLSDFPQEQDIIDGLLPSRGCIITGTGGAQKTTLMLQMALAISTGRPFLDMPVQKGKVAFYTAEEETNRMARKALQVCAGLGYDADDRKDIKRNFHICAMSECFDQSKLLEKAPYVGALQQSDLANYLKDEHLKQLGDDLKLIVFDPMAFFGLESEVNTNEQQLMAFANQLSAEYGCAVVFVHHVGKGYKELSDQYSARGGSSAADNARAVINMMRYQPKQDASGEFKFDIEGVVKHSYAAPKSTLYWLIRRDGWLQHYVSSTRPEDVKQAKEEARKGKLIEEAREFLDWLSVNQGVNQSKAVKALKHVRSRSAWLTRFAQYEEQGLIECRLEGSAQCMYLGPQAPHMMT